MTEADNPYYNFAEMMRGGKPNMGAPFLIGTVTAIEPLTVKAGDIPITRKNMKINSQLLAGYTRRMNLSTTAATGATSGSISIPSGSYTTLDGFSVGDEVLLLVSEDGQQYILLCKLK